MLAGLVVASAPAVADSRADRLFEQGRLALEAHDYKRACRWFALSFKADPAIGTQLNLALCHARAKRPIDAYRAYAKARVMARASRDDRLPTIEKLVDGAAKHVARVAIAIPRDAKLIVDGKVVPDADYEDELVLAPGTHAIAARLAGQVLDTHELTLRAGDRDQLTFETPAPEPDAEPEPDIPPPPEPAAPATTSQRRAGRLVVGGLTLTAGVAAIGVGSYLALDARKTYRAAAAMCPDNQCANEDAFRTTSDARARARAMTYVVGGGIVAAGIGVYLIATSGKRERAVVAMPTVGRHAIGVALGGSL